MSNYPVIVIDNSVVGLLDLAPQIIETNQAFFFIVLYLTEKWVTYVAKARHS